jgi:hypothetical protein
MFFGLPLGTISLGAPDALHKRTPPFGKYLRMKEEL